MKSAGEKPGRRVMNHDELLTRLDDRLKQTDRKIDASVEEIKELRKDLSKYATKTAVLENQMAGVVRVGFLIVGAVITILIKVFTKGL